MIVKVSKRCTTNESHFIVEYDTGKCKKFNMITTPIIQFIADKKPETKKVNNGTVIFYIWE